MEVISGMVVIFVSLSYTFGGGMSVLSISLVLLMGVMGYSLYTNMQYVCGGVFTDQLSYVLFLMSLMVCMASLVSSCKHLYVQEKSKGQKYKEGFESAVVGVVASAVVSFLVSNFFFFFFCFEFSLFPTLWLILGWGVNPERLQAGLAMMLYTVSASVPMLIILTHFYNWSYSADYLSVKLGSFQGFIWFGDYQWFAWGCMMSGFLVKLPMFTVHLWLPKAHVEAPLAGSMLLAGVLLKLSLYGMMRLSDVFSMKTSCLLSEFLLVLSLWGGFLTSCYCLCQSDIKALIAYSSIGQMSLCLAGVVSLYPLGWSGGLCLAFAHGLCSPLLFSMAGGVCDWSKSQNIILMKGFLLSFPSFGFWWCASCVMNMSFPPSLNFVGEMFCVSAGAWVSVYFLLPMSGICFLGGAYCLYLYGMICHGEVSSLVKSIGNLKERYLFSAVFLSTCLFGGILGSDFIIL